MYHFLQTSLSLTCTRQYSVDGEPSGHEFESLLLPEKFLITFFRHCAILSIFFGTVRLFFEICFVSKGSPLNFFDILQQTGFSKSRKGPPLTNFLKKCAFLSLRYSADFRRSRLVVNFNNHGVRYQKVWLLRISFLRKHLVSVYQSKA